MSDPVYTLHICDEREFRHRFLPALAGEGDEVIVRELLDAANAAGPSWTALHKMFDETRPLWNKAIETQDGPGLLTSGFAAFARLEGHLRPAFAARRGALSQIDRAAFPELASHVRSPGVLLLDEEGEPLSGIPANVPGRIPGRCQPGRSGGGVVLAKDVRAFLQALRGDLPRLAESFTRQGLPAEECLTILLAATVEAKLREQALFEACDALAGDTHLPADHLIQWPQNQDQIPLAVRREAGRLFGREVEAPREEPPRTESQRLRLSYSPDKVYRVGDEIEHKSFGTGEVTRVLDSRRLKVRFADDERTLAQGLRPMSERLPSASEDDAPDE